MEVFNIKLEFDHELFRKTIEDCVKGKGKGYVCVVDGNVLTITSKDEDYQAVVKQALVNTCDSSFIAKMTSVIYGQKYEALNGPRVFEHFIKQQYTQLLLGNTEETYQKIVEKMKADGGNSDNLKYLPVPFARVEDFDYTGIASQINEIKPDLIWVSLGAPKQERFMSKLLPYLDQGVMFGIGAAFNYYVGTISEPKVQIGGVRLVWLQRIFEEPKKQLGRTMSFIKEIPKLYREEKKRSKSK